jgi:hypothetical protein
MRGQFYHKCGGVVEGWGGKVEGKGWDTGDPFRGFTMTQGRPREDPNQHSD